MLNNTLYSVHRRHRLFTLDNWPQKETDNLSQIVLTTYKNKNCNQTFSEEIICNGNDPRVTSDFNRAFVLSQGALHSKTKYTLTVLPEKKNIIVKLDDGVDLGKNWQPVFKDNELYIIDSISPFRVNKIDINTGVITKEKQVDVDFALKATHDNYSILRGGSNAIVHNDTFYGWGHATIKPYSHIPFIWEYSQGVATTSFVNIHSFFKARGYNIVDPASFFEWDVDHFALSLSCSQREWFHSQWFLNVLVLINKKDFYRKRLPPLNLVLSPKSIFFHTTELDSLIESYQKDGRCNNGKKGCLVCGPSKEIDISKKWVVELCYSSPNNPSKRVGLFDLYLTINGVDKQVAKMKIFGTKGKSTRVKLSFKETSDTNKALIQTRVFTSRKVIVNAYFFELTYGE